ncbi:hypothetical protein [Phenylobacterium sp.]|jgi:hypothetical protein|uniref:hypothetical protein n=1 Tax=Phenylobacterium sp. TaxID=1871053 RepID=UPI002F950C91
MRQFPTYSRALAAAGLAASLCGCVTVDVPDRGAFARGAPVMNPTDSASPASYPEAMAYLQAARSALLRRARTHERIDTVTKAGVGIAVAGAGISSTLEHGGAKRAVKFLTAGAVSYMANRDIAPARMSAVYRAGLTNLDCIRTGAVAADTNVAALRQQILSDPDLVPRVERAIAALERDIDLVTSGSGLQANEDPQTYAADILNANTAISSARSALRQLRIFLANNGLGEQVLTGVNGTLQAVNQQALAQTPDIDAIFQSGSVFGTFLNTGATWTSQIRTAQTSLADALKASHSSTALKQRFGRDLIGLQAAISRIPSLSIDADLKTIGQCRTVFSVLKPVSVSPNPITLTAGGDSAKLTVTGTGPFAAHGTPLGIAFDGIAKPPTITAAASAAPGDYNFSVSDALGVDSGPIPLKVQAKPAAATGGAGASGGAGAGGGSASGAGAGGGQTGPAAAAADGPPPTPPTQKPGGGAG